MPGPLRIFISSSILDLPNERAEVASKLKELNVEPVLAEEMHPSGEDSWDHLKAEIESCDIFVLILGESYGYIPPSGPMSGEEKSVTELEFDHAMALGIPVLAFMKQLRPESGPPSEDARRREAFRKKVADWDGGLFRGEFNLARELAEKVAQAVVGLIADHFRANELTQRRNTRKAPSHPHGKGIQPIIPPALKEAAAARQLTLFLGAGASLSTGMPSAAAFVEAMLDRLQTSFPDYSPPRSGTLFNVLSTDFEALLGETSLYELASDLVAPSYVTESAPAHHIAARLFDDIVTTNFDELLEQAVGGDRFHVIDSEIGEDALPPNRRIFKLHGSISNPESLILTEPELANLEEHRSKLWAVLRELFTRQPILFVGSSLRDPSLIQLLEDCGDKVRGWAVMPEFNPSEPARLKRWNLELIHGDADSFLAALDAD
ncbi:MAG TPA: SIR2 family protein [Solirubrobacterales bacterium]